MFHPKSPLYEERSFSAILHHIQKIPIIIKDLYELDKEPEGSDYELGVAVVLRLGERRQAKMEKKLKGQVLKTENVL